ncbi:MAG: toll/interleukin-1 receptor domain-containing protein [Blastocatellia bacterium]
MRHDRPSTLGIDTIYKSAGNIPESFLRGCGLPDTFITFARSLVGTAIDFYSAFISYSSKNHNFAERLNADLQNKGVRCWFAPEDIKIGDKFRQRIDEAIHVQDKLLLILSEDSMASAWVELEVEAAMERERRENRLVLFPVRIDDAIEQSHTAWAASLRRMRHIGDFNKWKDHDSYSKAFERLLRDLKSEGKA